MNHSASAFMHAFLATMGMSSSVAVAIDSDFEYFLRDQKGGVTLPPQELDRKRAEMRDGTLRRLALFRRKTVTSLLFVLAASAIGVLFASVIAEVTLCPNVLAVTSIICFSWATLGRLGWAGQTLGGKTIFEELDSLIFWGLYGLGTLLGTLAVYIGASQKLF